VHARRSLISKVSLRYATAFRLAAGATIFSRKILECGVVEHGIGQELFELGVLVLERFKSLDLAHIHAAIFGFPFVDAGVAHAVFPAQVGDRNASLVLFKNADNLFFAEPVALHLWSFPMGQSLFQTGLAPRGNVMTDEDYRRR